MLFGGFERLMFGFMLPTWFLSMWVSNTATTAMMIPIVGAVLDEFKLVKKASQSGKISNKYSLNACSFAFYIAITFFIHKKKMNFWSILIYWNLITYITICDLRFYYWSRWSNLDRSTQWGGENNWRFNKSSWKPVKGFYNYIYIFNVFGSNASKCLVYFIVNQKYKILIWNFIYLCALIIIPI